MSFLWSFLVLTLRQPDAAARVILLRNWPREAVWTGLLLAVVLSALVYGLLNLWFPLLGQMALLTLSTGSYIAASLLFSVGFTALLSFCGRWLGGSGVFLPVLSLMVWLQFVQLALQLFLILVMMLSPLVGGLLSLLTNLVVFFVLLHFVNEAHGFASLWRSLAVVLMAAIICLFAMTFIVGFIGPSFFGLPDHV